MKTLYGNSGGARASKMSTPLHYSNLAASDTQKRPNLRQTLRKTSQIAPYGFIATLGMMASAEQAYAKQVGVSDVVAGATINPDDANDVLLDLSALAVSNFSPAPDTYANIIDLDSNHISGFVRREISLWHDTQTTPGLITNLSLGRGFVDITGMSVADSLKGSSEANTIRGEGGNDLLTGGDDNDWLYGEAGNDTLYGNTGNDRLDGGAGDDPLTGGIGKDTIVISIDSTGANTLNGSDTITDFDVTSGTGDIVQIAWQENSPAPSTLAAAGLALGTNGSNAVLTDSTDTSIIYLTFEGIAQADLAEATHFEFV